MSSDGLAPDSIISVYDKNARKLGDEWSATSAGFGPFLEFHRPYLPSSGDHALDIGAGYGSHVRGLENLGLNVVAVEPAAGMRAEAERRHPTEHALWLDDRLPELAKVRELSRQFDFMVMNAVWMHVMPEDREAGMATLAALLAPGGHFSVLLRHGPAPADRPMHVTDAAPFIALAGKHGLSCIYREGREDKMGRPGTSFTRLILSKPGAGT